ncbi:MAG TPA: peroxiredoxin family protein, partial [Candidatus Binatia bacterium]
EKHASKIKSMENSIAELKLYQLIATGETNDALKQIKEVKDIPNERLSRLYLKLGEKEKAIERAESAVKNGTNEVQVLANYIDILTRCDKAEEADKQLQRLQAMAAYADLDLPIFARLNSFEKAKPKPSTDVGERPPLDRLGPFRWSPSPAPDWVLRDSEEKKVSLRDFRGRPVLVIFYLGHGCVHCLEQLNLFAPMAAQYESAGISMIAISTDSVEGLHKTLAQSKSGDGFPFPIVSNDKLDVFKAYRAYDDFEKMPLHGTFLVDAQGLVRWQDISYEPFNEPEFLLKEARRLLKLPAAPLLTQKKPLHSPKATDL